MKFGRFSSFIFDLDGTVWDVERIYPGFIKIYRKLVELGKQVLFVTNHTMLSRNEMVRKLKKLGVNIRVDQLINSGYVAGRFLEGKQASVMAFGDGLKKDLKVFGIRLRPNPPVDYVAIGHDIRFNYLKLAKACEAVSSGAKLLTTALGKWFVKSGRLYPGTGGLVAGVEYITGVKATLVGKPSDHMLKVIKNFVGSPPEKTVIFGDELGSDILMGKKAGWTTVLVKTGVDKAVKGRVRPDLVIQSVAEIELS